MSSESENKVEEGSAEDQAIQPSSEDQPELKADPMPDMPTSADASASQQVIVQKRGGFVATLAFLLSLVACTGVAWLWYTQPQPEPVELPEVEIPDYQPQIDQLASSLRSEISDLAQTGSRSEQALADYDNRVASLDNRLSSLDSRLEVVRSSVGELEARQDQANDGWDRRFSVIENNVSRLADQESGSDSALSLMEIEFLVSLANERMVLFSDPVMALKALRLADERLVALDDAVYTSVRRALGEDIQRLEAVEWPDRVALVEQLAQLARASVDLPIDARRSLNRDSANLLKPDENEGEGLWSDFKSMLSEVVVVHRVEGEELRLLTLEEERLLKENLRLQLQVSQLAVAQSDQSLFVSSLETAVRWLDGYYETSDQGVTAMRESLSGLQQVRLNPELPDISGSLRQLRQMRAAVSVSEQVEAGGQ